MNFWDSNVWSTLLLISIILFSLLIGHQLRKLIPFLRKSLIPASVIGGTLLLILASVWKWLGGVNFFDLDIFEGVGVRSLEILTYHCLGIGFVAMALRESDKKFDKKRTAEIFDSGVITVSTYLIQAIVGLVISIVFVLLLSNMLDFKSAGLLLPFGYGQGTGQALNYGTTYENKFGFDGGKSFGLAIAALGFISAAIGGVIYLNILRRKGKIDMNVIQEEELKITDFHGDGEIGQSDSIDKLTIQCAIVFGTYMLSYFLMYAVGLIGDGVKSIMYGFNFLLGTLLAVLVKFVLKKFRQANIIKHQYISNYFMNRIGGFAFDVMIVAGIAAIQVDLLKDYWLVLIIMGVVGALVTFFYIRFVSIKLFPDYKYEQFFAMYGMLTGTASTGVILLREIDPKLSSKASENIVYQSLPAIVFGFPMMLLASFAPESDINTYITLGILILFLVAMTIILFRRQIFKKKIVEEKSTN